MPFQWVILWTDALIYLLVVAAIFFIFWVRSHEHLRTPWREVARSRLGMITATILLVYVAIGLLDSIHVRTALPKTISGEVFYNSRVESVLDILMHPLDQPQEKTYSAPFALYGYNKITTPLADGKQIYTYPRLQYAGRDLKSVAQKNWDIGKRLLIGLVLAFVVWSLLSLLLIVWLTKYTKQKFTAQFYSIIYGKTLVPWRAVMITVGILLLVISVCCLWAAEYHILGTDRIGQDIFYQTLKSIHTGLIIGTITTLFMLPFAILFGTTAGYFGGWLDDIIQYIYATLSSIPGVLLITAAIISLQIFISNHQSWFPNLAVWADARLLALCAVLGIASWTSLCRLLRGETLKLREMDFVQAALAMGVKPRKIIARHILPNVMHIILITIVLDFSALVLAEAVLSYIGVGVDPTTISWGNMINSARLELARDPIVWWPLLSALIFMFGLVLTANLFADTVRDAFDPRLRNTRR